MLKHCWNIAWRHLVKNRQFTLLNLAGLAIGLGSAITIFWWTGEERRVDAFLNPRLYQVLQNGTQDDGKIWTTGYTPDLLAPALKAEFPEIADVAVVKSPDLDGNATGIVTAAANSLKAREGYVTKNFFSLFGGRLVQGNLDQAFAPGNHILLSATLAKKLFHDNNPLGQPISWDRGASGNWNGTFTVAAVYADAPDNASQSFDCIFPHSIYAAKPGHDISWFSSNPATFVLLKPDVDPDAFNNKIKDFIRNKFKSGSQEWKWVGQLIAQRVKDRYLYNRYENGRPAGGRIEYVRLFSLIAIFVLVIACINFMNLSTAKALTRIKEVGIQKVVGARRTTLILQYLGEALLMTILALGLAILLIAFLRPGIEAITGKTLAFRLTPATVAAIIGITLFTGLLAGSYPALFLSRFSPMSIFKNTLPGNNRSSLIRKGLVVFQFTIAAGFIVSVLVIYNQMSLIQTHNLGYDRDHLIHFPNEGAIGGSQQAFLAELRTIPGVVRATEMEGDLLGNHSGGGGIDWPGKTGRVEFSGAYTGYDFLETMGLQLKEGRGMSRDYGADTAASAFVGAASPRSSSPVTFAGSVIFNETAIAAMHLKDPIGKTVTMWGAKKRIIGIVKDFHYESLYKPIGPFFIAFERNPANLVVRIRANATTATLAGITALYKKYNPGLPFEYSFVSEDYQALYKDEQRLSLLSRYFAAIAIGISCLGLFGLTAFSAERRRKEIGIRKVIGASLQNLVVLLSADFLKLIGIALLIAFPLSAWLMSRWLDNFAYRQPLGIGTFLIAGAGLFLCTIITISFQSIKAAVSNPIESLRSE
ncbi:ABC transporter permease [Puia sp.]|uniref:ABC transporter permease n=1 Tax=Puia sp. TaxID=2045100 RepID=UPI002F401706